MKQVDSGTPVEEVSKAGNQSADLLPLEEVWQAGRFRYSAPQALGGIEQESQELDCRLESRQADSARRVVRKTLNPAHRRELVQEAQDY